MGMSSLRSEKISLKKYFSDIGNQDLQRIPAEDYFEAINTVIRFGSFPGNEDSAYFSLTENNELAYSEVPISNTVIVPVFEKQIHYKTNETQRKLMLIAIRAGVVLEPAAIDVTKLTSIERFMKETWGFKCRLYPVPGASKQLVDFITFMCKFVPEVHEYNYIGWSNIHKGVYITGSGPIGTHEGNFMIGEDLSKEFALCRSDVPNREAFLFTINKILKLGPQHVSYNCLSFMILSLFTSQLQEWVYSPQFSVVLQAPTGTGKTSVAKVFFSLYEKHVANVGINFSATWPAMEQEMLRIRDTVCLIDDIAPPVNAVERSAITKKLENILRSIGDSAGRKKLDFQRKQVAMNPSCLVAMTAELNVMNSKSSLARSIILKMDHGDVDFDTLSHVQEHKYHFPTAMYFFIKHMSMDLTGYIDHVKGIFLRNRQFFLHKMKNIHGRLIDAAAWLHTAFEMYIKYGEENSFLERKRASKLLQRNLSMLLTLIGEQDQLLKMEDPTDLFIHALKQLEATNSIRIAEIKLDGHKKVVPEDKESNRKIIGFRDFDNIYLVPNAAFSHVKSYYSRQGVEYPGNLRLVFDSLLRSGLLKPDRNKDGTRTVRIMVNGNRIEVIRLDLDKYQTWLNGTYENPYKYYASEITR